MNIGDIINPVGSLLGGIVSGITGYTANQQTNKTNLAIARETNEANKNLAQYAYDMNLQQWNRENEYNSPAQQMARLQKAGLNPNLIYGNGQAVRASAESPQYRPPEMKAAHMQPWSGSDFGITTAAQNYYAGAQAREVLANQIKQNQYLSTQNDYMQQQIVGMTLDIANKLTRNEHDKFNLDLAKELKQNTILQAFENLDKTKNENANLVAERIQKEENTKLIQEKLNLTRKEAIKIDYVIDNIASSTALNRVLSLEAASRTDLNKSRKTQLDFTNELNAATYDTQVKTIKQNLTNLIITAKKDTWSANKFQAEALRIFKQNGYTGNIANIQSWITDLWHVTTGRGVPMKEAMLETKFD